MESIPYPNLEADDNTFRIMKNILTRSGFLSEILENSAVFYDYQVKDGETPEIIAHKLYGSVDRFWLVLLFNNIMNPYYDFPLTSDQLNDLIQDKYGIDAETAQSTLKHYEKLVRRDTQFNGSTTDTAWANTIISAQEADPNTGLATDVALLPSVGGLQTVESYEDVIDSTTSVVTRIIYRALSVYDYEVQENEKRRSIKLLDPAYAGKVEAEYKRLMNA
jgi:hypothetical protein